MDVKSDFLHGELQEETSMQQPLGFVHHAWYEKIHNFFINHGFTYCEVEHDLCIRHQDGTTVIILLYVDNILLTSHTTSMNNDIKQQCKDSLEITDLGLLHSFPGL
jgi:hypothetical protein